MDQWAIGAGPKKSNHVTVVAFWKLWIGVNGLFFNSADEIMGTGAFEISGAFIFKETV